MLKVLITDDEQMICNLIANILDWEDMGFQIIGMANTGTDAFDIIQKEKPDVVISDIRMPGYDGIQLIQKTAEAGIQAVFVMISGYKQFEYAQNAMKYGVKYYLLKPINIRQFLQILSSVSGILETKRNDDGDRQRTGCETTEDRRRTTSAPAGTGSEGQDEETFPDYRSGGK